jgi:hypothetical protein
MCQIYVILSSPQMSPSKAHARIGKGYCGR